LIEVILGKGMEDIDTSEKSVFERYDKDKLPDFREAFTYLKVT